MSQNLALFVTIIAAFFALVGIISSVGFLFSRGRRADEARLKALIQQEINLLNRGRR